MFRQLCRTFLLPVQDARSRSYASRDYLFVRIGFYLALASLPCNRPLLEIARIILARITYLRLFYSFYVIRLGNINLVSITYYFFINYSKSMTKTTQHNFRAKMNSTKYCYSSFIRYIIDYYCSHTIFQRLFEIDDKNHSTILRIK